MVLSELHLHLEGTIDRECVRLLDPSVTAEQADAIWNFADFAGFLECFKFAAQLQYCQPTDGPPVLIRIETRAGHGAGRPTAMIIEEAADQWAFLVRNLKMKVQADKN